MATLRNSIAALLAAGSLALLPAPAAAGEDDVAKLIAGLIAAGIIAKVIDDRKDRDELRKSERRSDQGSRWRLGSREDRHTVHRHGRYHRDRIVLPHRYGGYYRDKYKSERRYSPGPLPTACLYKVNTYYGWARVFSSRCLNHRYRYADRLPERCETLVRTRSGPRRVFGERCLLSAGYRVGH